jgi:hypothetical protein
MTIHTVDGIEGAFPYLQRHERDQLLVATVDECRSDIDEVRVAVDNSTFMGNQAGKDEAGLLTKLNAAEAKLLQGKFDDAVAKLIDFKDAVMALRDAAKPKIRA